MTENICYEMLAKIAKNNELKISNLTEAEITITELNGLNNALTEVYSP